MTNEKFTFSDPVFASTCVRKAMSTRLSRATGSVVQDDVTKTLKRFVEPEGFTAAALRLAHERLVVLYGAPGTGKRTSALSLLHEVTDEGFYMFSPQVPLAELGEHDYSTGCGYLVIDRVVDRETTESDSEWRRVRERLATQQAYLVVTTTVAPESVKHFTWHPPNAERMLRTHWPHEWPSGLRDALNSADRVSDVVDLARRLRKGDPPHVAIEHFDATMRARVAEWLSTAPPHQILEVATRAFTQGVDGQLFEIALALLRVALHMPSPALRGRPAELVTAPGLHQHVLSALWRQMDARFWAAVRDWLDVIVLRPPYEQSVAIGLAKLADAALGEVLPTLDRWARGQCGTPGQRAAVYTLWLMAHEDALAPAALQTATKWITQGEPAHRWVAAMTFSGQLGVRYPHEAVNMLWQLCVQSHTAAGDVEMVFGELFNTLVRETSDGGIVLSALADKAERFIRRGARPGMCAVAARTALAAVAVKDPMTDRVAVLSYLAQFPDRTDTVAGLLARVLANPPLRSRAMHALQAILEDLAKNEEYPEERAHALGQALATRLDDDEREALARELPVVAGDNSVVATLLNAL